MIMCLCFTGQVSCRHGLLGMLASPAASATLMCIVQEPVLASHDIHAEKHTYTITTGLGKANYHTCRHQTRSREATVVPFMSSPAIASIPPR